MVCLLGSEVVVGKEKSTKSRNKYFSDNIPKTVIHEASSQNTNLSTLSFKKDNESKSIGNEESIKALQSFDDEASVRTSPNVVFTWDSAAVLH